MNQPVKPPSQPIPVPRPNAALKPLAPRKQFAQATALKIAAASAQAHAEALEREPALLDADVGDGEPTRQMSPQHLSASVRASVAPNDEPSGIQRRALQRREQADQVSEWFRLFARKTAHATGSPFAFAAAAAIIVLWAISGPIFGFSDTWQLVINTSTTVVTFLMVFVVQATQNRDNEAIHLKLDELLRAIDTARSSMIDIETLPERELRRLAEQLHDVSGQRSGVAAHVASAQKSASRALDQDG